MILKYSCENEQRNTSLTNGDVAITIYGEKVVLKALKDVTLVDANISFSHEFHKDDLFFLNGYQSWTDTKEFKFSETLRDVRKIPKFMDNIWKFSCYGDSFIVDYKKSKFHAFDIGYVRGSDPLFIASKNYQNAYLVIEFLKDDNLVVLRSDVTNKELKAGEEFVLFDYLISSSIDSSMKAYFEKMAPKSNKKLFGYTSWYNYYQNINEDIILNSLTKADSRFDLFQIDDGYETFVGDWMNVDKNKFPNGLSPIIKKIKEKNMLSGIWLAPFVAETNSELFKNHNDYIARYDNGEMVCAGGNWSKFYALDLDKPEVVSYIKECLKYHKDLGFDFFKLDFLYAASKKPMKGKTHAETAEFAYNLINEVIGDKLILGCGAIPSNSYGKFDYLRIGPDITLTFDDVFYMKLMHRERVSTKITLQNSVWRYAFNGHAFLNDPDVFLLRDDNIKLKKSQKEAVLLINSLFGSLLMTSDNPLDYDDEKKALLNEGLERFRNAKVLSYETVKKGIKVTYSLNDKEKSFIYNVKKGEVTNG
ncbi:MAG: alpha-galactosidase [Bacilli bacterium]|nr:alpha-galactosidase [Bacilli bacterium]